MNGILDNPVEQHWLVGRPGNKPICPRVSTHLDSRELAIFSLQHTVEKTGEVWVRDGDFRELQPTPELLRQLSSVEALAQHGIARYDFARAA